MIREVILNDFATVCMLISLVSFSDDTVYMPDEHLLKEYVLKDTGVIYVGNSARIAPRSWVFEQVMTY